MDAGVVGGVVAANATVTDLLWGAVVVGGVELGLLVMSAIGHLPVALVRNRFTRVLAHGFGVTQVAHRPAVPRVQVIVVHAWVVVTVVDAVDRLLPGLFNHVVQLELALLSYPVLGRAGGGVDYQETLLGQVDVSVALDYSFNRAGVVVAGVIGG